MAPEPGSPDKHFLVLPDWSKELPLEWGWHRLDSVCLEIADCPHSTPEIVQGGPYLMARTSDILSGVLRTDEARRVSESTYLERIRRAEPRDGDLLYSREGTYFGLAAEVPHDTKVCLGQRMVLLRPDSKQVHPTYLRYWLNSSRIQSHIEGHRDGSVAERLNLPTIRCLPVCTPPLLEQRAIAHILGTLDDKIELNRRMNETLEAIARALFKSWFVDFDPVRAKAAGRDPRLPKHLAGFFPDSLEDSELGEIPNGWRVASIGYTCEVIDCLHSKKPERKDTGRPLLQLNNIRDDGLIDMSDSYLIEPADYDAWISRMEGSPGDCVITNVGRVGAVAQIPEGIKAALGRNMTGIRCKQDFHFPTFLIECLLSDAMKTEILMKIDSGTILESLNVRNIPRLRFVRAPERVMECFERLARPFRARMEHGLSQSHTLAALRDTLLPKLISGELRVKGLGTTEARRRRG